MSGSDWKRLLDRHRKDELVNAYVSGSRRGKSFTDVDYDMLLNDLQLKKEVGNASAVKVNSLVHKANESKEEKLMTEHKKAWRKMFLMLELQQLHECLQQLEVWRSTVVLEGLLNEFLSEVYLMESELQSQRSVYEQNLMGEVRLLHRQVMELVKLKGVLSHARERGKSRAIFRDDANEQIKTTKKKLAAIKKLLSTEWTALTNDLQSFENQYINVSNKQFQGGVAKEVWSENCPSNSLRQKMANEFKAIDRHYQTQLEFLGEQYNKTTKNLLLDWNDEDGIRFDLILLQYPPSIKNRRALYIDRLMKELPGKSRKEIVDYESWSSAAQYYKTQKAVLIDSWRKAHNALLVKVREAFTEAVREWKLKEIFDMESSQQKKICNALSDKVRKWREHCLKEQLKEAERVANQALEFEAFRKKEEEQLKMESERVKKKVMEYNQKKEQEREEEAKRQRHLVEEVRRMTEDEVKKGKEREQLLVTKKEELVAMADIAREKEREREERLEALRQLVRIEVPRDPRRARKDTESSRARVLSHDEDTSLELQHPLFQVTSFTDQKILSDKRFQVSNALREAGLISTHYAQRVLSSIPPPRPPRRDQKSSLFK